MEMEYNNHKKKLSLPKNFSEFKELCIQTFYISKLRSEKMCFFYYDEDNDENQINDENYNSDDSLKATYWKLIIKEEDEEEETESQLDSKEIEDAKRELIVKKEKLVEELKNYKKKYFEKCNEIIKTRIEEKNKIHKENIQKIKDDYINNLKEFKKEIDEQRKAILEKLSENTLNVYMEKVKLIEQGVLENMREPLKKLSSDIEEDLDVPKIKEIGENIEIMKDNINECKEVFQKKLVDSQVLMIYKIDEKIEIKKQINELNKLEFNLNITNLKKDKISSEKFFLEINREKGDSELIPIDLSDIEINHSKEKKIEFNPNIKELGEFIFKISIVLNNCQISNTSILILNVNELGSNFDLFQ